MSQPVKSIDDAFASVPDLKRRIYKAITIQPQNGPLFDDVSKFVLSLQSTPSTVISNGNTTVNEPPPKKRKLEDSPLSSALQPPNGPRRTILEARDLSFTLPQRKKLHLGIIHYGTNIHEQPGTFAIQARNPSTNQVEFEYPLDAFEYILRLPVPEKNTKQYNFCFIPRFTSGSGSGQAEAILFTVNHGPLKSCKIDDEELRKVAPGPEDVLENALGFVLGKSGNGAVSLTLPSEEEFASATRESHRKSDVAYHVKAFRGSKEGYLFFLPTGIFFGFKKPLSFYPFHDIESISYTSVLQRTFNLTITVRTASNDADAGEAETQEQEQEIEYSMLDQGDFTGIDGYIRRHGLQDGSLADARRAKRIGKNKANGGVNGEGNNVDGDNSDGEDDGRTELEKAQAELEDEEDELEEDYDPDEGSGSDDGSGSESGSDDETEAVYTRGKGRDLIAEELGSEAEDVEVTEDEEEEEQEEERGKDDEDMDTEPPPPSRPPQPPAVTVSQKPAPGNVSFPSRAIKVDRYAPELDDEDQL